MVPWAKSMPAIHFKMFAWVRQCLSFNLQCSVIDPIGFLCGSVRYVVRFPYVAPQCQFVHWHYPVLLPTRSQAACETNRFVIQAVPLWIQPFCVLRIGESVKDQHRITSEKNSSLMLGSHSLLRSTASFNELAQVGNCESAGSSECQNQSYF